MEFHQLRYFVAAADAGSITAAARGEHVTQPAMSRQIALLERRLGTPLFERFVARSHAGKSGATLLAEAKRWLSEHAD